MIRPAEDEPAEGHSGRKFRNPEHEQALNNIFMVAPHLKPNMN